MKGRFFEKKLVYIIFFVALTDLLARSKGDLPPILNQLQRPKELELVLLDIIGFVTRREPITCIAVICDTVYLNVFEGSLFRRTYAMPIIMIVVPEYEDLLSPNFITLEALRQARKDGCNMYVILLANGLQASRLLKFGDRHRIIDTRAKFVMLHDFRLFHSELHYIWKRIVNVIFLKYHGGGQGFKNRAWFDLSTVPFPNPIRQIFVSKRVDIWKNGRFHYNRALFEDKTLDLNGEVLNVVYLDHVPSVVVEATNSTNRLSGVEIEILNALAIKMNFKPKLYQPQNVDLHRWGYMQPNGSFSGLLGEMVSGKADIALGNLQYTPYHLELTDLSKPYISQCMTFLTPEALTDNSWKTLILPFKLYMWITVLLVLLITGVIFCGLANYYIILVKLKKSRQTEENTKKNKEIDDEKPVGLYLFGEIINSILYTYGMLLLVSLPKLPSGWSIRLLTGWYWLYCLLVVVSYRASMTAILANPTPRVTIDTLKELVDSKITCGGWGTETKKFFTASQDEVIHKIGEKFESINNPDLAAKKVAQGIYAYYENIYFLKFLSVKKKSLSTVNSTFEGNLTISNDTELSLSSDVQRSLHIMSDCVVNIPVSIGFQKNSPLKPLADIYISRIVEVGLVEKWLTDAMYPSRLSEKVEDESKALMNLKKLYGAFIALAIGYSLSFISLLGELLHWHLVVKRDPRFDKYAMDLYYSNKNK